MRPGFQGSGFRVWGLVCFWSSVKHLQTIGESGVPIRPLSSEQGDVEDSQGQILALTFR